MSAAQERARELRASAPSPGRSTGVRGIGALAVGVLRLVVKRALGNPSLVVFTIFGLVVSVALTTAVPLYSDGMVAGLLRREVARPSGSQPPLAVRVRHQENRQRPTPPEQIQRLDRYLGEGARDVVGLPLQGIVRRLTTRTQRILPHAPYAQELPRIAVPGETRYAEITALSDMARHVRAVEGELLPAGPSGEGEVPVVLTRSAADELRMEVGERYWYLGPDLERPEKLLIRVVGLWEPTDPGNVDYWQDVLADVTFNFTLFVGEADFFERVLPAFPNNPALAECSWYLVFDPGALQPPRVDRVRRGLRSLELDVARLMPDTRFEDSPEDTLEWVSRQSSVLKTLLFVLSAPLLAVALYYVYVSLTMVVEHQSGEIAFLRSRGASGVQVLLIFLAEGAVTGLVAVGAGLAAGAGVAQLIGKSAGFLQFAVRPPLPTYLGAQALQYALLTVGLALACAVVPAARAIRYSVVAHERQAARVERLVQWSGLAFEALLVAVAVYGYYSLKSGAPLVRAGEVGQFLVDPLLLFVPSVSVCALGLVFRRLVPLLVAIAALCLARVAGAPTLLAVRHVYRAPAGYAALVFLVVVTLGMGIFSASAARTLETNYVDRAKYRAPATLALLENWQFDPDSPTQAFLEPPLSALEVPGVRAITRTQLYAAKPTAGQAGMEGAQMLGLDRESFARVSWWRDDFAGVPLGALMNDLSTDERALIVSSSFLKQSQLRVGDQVQISFMAGGMGFQPVDFLIVEAVDYFPTLYPERGHFFVANLDYLHDQLGLGIYTAWLAVDPAVRTARVIDAIAANGVEVVSIQDQRVEVNLGRLDPQRTGILGLLSLAYVVSATLTVFGFFLHTLLSFQRRTPQLGVLRTIGLSSSQLVRVLLVEQSLVVALGVGAGTGFGVLASRLFIPLLQLDVDRLGTTPPFVVETAWADARWICLVLALMLGAGLVVLLGLIRHMRLDQAIRLGERV